MKTSGNDTISNGYVVHFGESFSYNKIIELFITIINILYTVYGFINKYGKALTKRHNASIHKGIILI